MLKIKSLTALLIIFLLTECNIPKEKKGFEGKITYVNSFECYHPKKDINYYQSIYGDTVIIYLKDGNYHQVYNSKSKKGIKSLTYLSKLNQSYLKTNLNDSVQVFLAQEDPNKIVLQKKLETSEEKIFGLSCEKLSFESEFKGYSKSNLQNTYYFSRDTLNLEPGIFSAHTMSYLNQLSFEGNFYLKYVFTDYETHKRIQTAIKIEEIKVDSLLFKIN